MEQIKVVYITTQYPVGQLNRNGMYIYRTAKELSTEFEMIILALHPMVPPIIPMLKNITKFSSIFKEWINKFPKDPHPPSDLADIKVIYSKFFRLPRPKFQFTEAWGAYYNANKIIRKIITKNTILHSNWIFPESHLAYLFARKYNLPFLITLRGSEFAYLKKSNLNGKFAARIFNEAKKITAVTNELFQQAKKKEFYINPNKTLVLNDFYDFNIFKIYDSKLEKDKLCLDEQSTNILFPGALRKIKNIYLILKSLIQLKDKNNNTFKLFIAGYGYEENNLKEFVRSNNLIKNVSFLGNLTPNELVSYYNACELVCLPSFSEGFPTVIVESLLCGTPVVASNVGGIPDIIKEEVNGFLIDPNSVSSLTNNIIKCINKEWNKEALRDSVAYLSRENQLRKFTDVYKNILISN